MQSNFEYMKEAAVVSSRPGLALTKSLVVLRTIRSRSLIRSAIFYHSEEQKQAAEEVIAAVQPKFSSKIVTEVVAASDWYPADKGHQDYYNRNKSRCARACGPYVWSYAYLCFGMV